MTFQVKNNVYWVGIKDWELQKFHGNEYSTDHSTTYNSYLIKEEKTVLIDTVWKPFSSEFVKNLTKEMGGDLNKIDYIVANHGEIDHSGALPELMALIPDTPIYCTKMGVEVLKGHYHKDWNFHVVKTGDTLDIGNGKALVFVEMRMLHWPDSMATYLTQDAVLFSNDAFGQHYVNDFMWNDLVDQDLLWIECLKYYANILTPFSALVVKKINEVLALKIPIDIIATSHGVIWRDNPLQIVNKYMEWAQDYQENQVTLIYDTMWNGTRAMAESISEGLRATNPTIKIQLLNAAKTDKNDIMSEVFKSKAILVGSPTIGGGILTSIAEIMEMVKGLRFKNKKAASFGCYGWSGQAVKELNKMLEQSKFELLNEGIRTKWNPDDASRAACVEFGKGIGLQLK